MRRDCQYLSECRNEIKGFAILWVVLFHARLGLEGWAYQLQRIGYGGVDLFFFLSGYGLCHSLQKDADLGRYLMRRARRLLPAYVPFCLVWLAVMLPMYGAGMAASVRIAAGNLSMLGFFADIPLLINWYPGGLALCIFAAPVFYAALRPGRRYALRAAALLSALFAAGLAFVGEDTYMAVARLPVFALGMLFAKAKGEDGKGASIGVLAACGIAGLAALFFCLSRFTDQTLCDYALYWHPFVLIVPALCVGLGWLFAHAPGAARAPFAALGAASFEIFLCNAWVELAGKRFGLCQTPAQWALWSLASLAAGLAYHVAVRAAMRKKSEKSG